VDEMFHNVLADEPKKKHITLLTMDENPEPFSVQMMYAKR
jgi:hypothetical protein